MTTMKHDEGQKEFAIYVLITFFGLIVLGLLAEKGYAISNRIGHDLDATLEDVIVPPFYMMSVAADGKVEVTLPTDDAGLPDCKELEISGCEWESRLRQDVDGSERVIETDLVKDGKVVGKAQVMEIETADYEQLHALKQAGHEKAWISHIKVVRAYRGNGLGKALWRASDSMIKVLVGSGSAVHIFVDQAGWGNAIISKVAAKDVVLAATDYWAYIVR